MTRPDGHDTAGLIEPETVQERAFLAAYRELDEAGRVLLWSKVLAELGRRSDAEPEEGPCP